jgi:hypothetical protein
MLFGHVCEEILIPLYGNIIATVLWLTGGNAKAVSGSHVMHLKVM